MKTLRGFVLLCACLVSVALPRLAAAQGASDRFDQIVLANHDQYHYPELIAATNRGDLRKMVDFAVMPPNVVQLIIPVAPSNTLVLRRYLAVSLRGIASFCPRLVSWEDPQLEPYFPSITFLGNGKYTYVGNDDDFLENSIDDAKRMTSQFGCSSAGLSRYIANARAYVLGNDLPQTGQFEPLQDRLSQSGLGNALQVARGKSVAELNRIADLVISTDAQGWFSNRYVRGSTMRSEVNDHPGDTIQIFTFYRYNGNQEAFVGINITNPATGDFCLRYEDNIGQCRTIRNERANYRRVANMLRDFLRK